MGSDRQLILRRKLFDHYAGRLAAIYSQHTGHYACPLCLRLFPRSSVEAQADAAPELTIEDVIPRGLGKKLHVLTCKRCNNDVGGSTLDTHLHARLALDTFLSLGGTTHAELFIDGHRVKSIWTRTILDGHTHDTYLVDPSRSDPSKIVATRTALATAVQTDTPPPSFSVATRTGNERLADVSLLKIAYLLCFHKFAYGYILSSQLDLVRQQIQSPHDDLLPLDAIILRFADAPKASNAVVILNQPEGLDAILGFFKLRPTLDGSPYRGVILPSSTSPSDFFSQLKQLQLQKRLRVTGKAHLFDRTR